MQDGDAVNKLGAELMQLFSLHSEVYQLAAEAGRGGSKKGRKPAADEASQVCCLAAGDAGYAWPCCFICGFVDKQKRGLLYSVAAVTCWRSRQNTCAVEGGGDLRLLPRLATTPSQHTRPCHDRAA
jgi:hypothetical protein